MFFWSFIILAVTGLGSWWLTGLDKTAGGQSKRSHYLTRMLRCGGVLILMTLGLWPVWSGNGILIGWSLIVIPTSIAIILRSGLAEFFTSGVLRLIDPALHENRAFDPREHQRRLDTLSRLLRAGKVAAARDLSKQLRRSGEADPVALDNLLTYYGLKPATAPPPPPLARARRLRQQKQFGEAERLLQSLLAANPGDSGAAIMLARLYAEDLRQPDAARKLLDKLAAQNRIPASHLDFARRSLAEWSRPAASEPEPPDPAAGKSLDELLAEGFFGTAVERLEANLQAQPQDPALWLKLAEVNETHFGSSRQTERIFQRMKNTGHFNPAQMEAVRAQLSEWRASRRREK